MYYALFMARIPSVGQNLIPHPSRVQRQAIDLGGSCIGSWTALNLHQAWTRLEIRPNQGVKIASRQSQMSGTLRTDPSGDFVLTLHAGAGESTATLEGSWRIANDELYLELPSMTMAFKRVQASSDIF